MRFFIWGIQDTGLYMLCVMAYFWQFSNMTLKFVGVQNFRKKWGKSQNVFIGESDNLNLQSLIEKLKKK